MRIFITVMGFVLVACAARAQASAEHLARCAAIPAAALRLQCYDALAKPKVDSASDSPRELPSGSKMIENWLVSVETDPISDQKGVTFMLEAEGATRIDTPSLIIRCKRGELDAYVAPDEYLGDGNNRVTIRFGSEPPVQQRWSESSNHTALFHPGGRTAVEAFVRKLAQYDRVAMQVTPYQKAPMAMVFDLAGIAQVSQELWGICPAQTK